MAMTPDDMARIQRYLTQKFKRDGITLKARAQADDSAEVLIDGEFTGVVYKDDEDPSDVSFDFNMAILDVDLPAVA